MQENLHEGDDKQGKNNLLLNGKNNLLLSGKNTEDIANVLHNHFTAVLGFENKIEELSVLIPQMRKMYDQEKKQLSTFQELLAEERIAPRHVYEHADIVQDKLEKRQNMVNNQRKKIKSLVDFFEDQNDRMSCHARINDFHTTFKDIFYDIREITEQQKDLVKKV